MIDGEGTSLSATIDDGQTSVNVPITIKTSSSDYATDAKVTLTILSAREFAGARYRVGTTASAEIGVTNSASAALPVITVTGVNITEGGAAADISFSLDKDAGAGGVSITAVVDTTNSTATETTDYSLSTKTVSIAESSRTGVITVTVVNDDIDEADNETFVLDLTATGATFSGGANTGSVSNTIVDNDDAPVLSVASFAVADSSASTVNFEVTLVGETARDVSLAYVIDATDSSATEGTDFSLGDTSPLVIAAGTKSGMIPISILADGTTGEGAETVVLDLTATNATFTGGSTTDTVTGTITDLPIASISTRFAGVSDADYLEYTVTLSEAPGSGNSTFVFLTRPSFPLDDNFSSTVIFTGDQTEQVVRISFTGTFDDAGVDPTSFNVSINTNANYTVNPMQSAVSIPVSDNFSDPAVSVTTAAGSIDEGGNFDVVLTADNTLDPADTITVNIAVADTGSVTGYFDAYTPAEVTISGATRTATVNITTNGDDQDRGDGEITLQVEPGAGYKLGTPSSVAFTINEDDAVVLPVITVTGVNITEGGAAADISFSLDKDAGAGGVSITAVVDTTNSTATETTDYSLSTKTVSIAESSRTGVITVTVVNDDIDEADNETFVLDLTATGATFSGGANTGSVSNTIVDNDDAPVLSVASFAVADSSASTVNFEVTLVGETARDVSLAYVIDATDSSATEGTDFSLGDTSPLVIAAGTKSGMIPISILADGTTGEGAETVVLDLTATNATFTGGSTTDTVTGTITDLPIASISTRFAGVSDADYLEYTVTLSEAPGSGNSTFVFLTRPSFPLDDNFSSTVIFTGDQTEQVVRISFTGTFDDAGVDPTSFNVSINTNANYTVNPMQSAVSIPVSDNFSDPAVSVTTAAGSIDEGGNFDVVLTADNTLDPADTITVNIAVADTGSVTGYFDAYTPAEVTISGATRTATVNITTNGDDQDRGDGEITLQVEPGAGYKLGTPSSVAFTINEDDAVVLPVITVTGVNITEGGAAADISFSLDKDAGAGGVSITAVVDTTNSTATETTDYSLSTKTVSIAESSRTGVITVTVVNDDIDEADNETFVLDLTATGATFSGGANTGSVSNTIVDNDDAPVLSVASFAVADSSASTVNFEVTLVGETARDVSLAYVIDATDSSATEGTDFSLGDTSPLVIAAGTKSGMIPISILADGTTGEGAETVVLDLTATNATFTGGSTTDTVTGTITDLPIASISTRFAGVSDADYLEYTVTLSEAPGSGNSTFVFLTRPSFPLDDNFSSTVIFTGDQTEQVVRISFTGTFDDAGVDPTSFNVSINTNANYTVNPMQSAVSIPVSDNFSDPAVSVTTAAGSIDEGGNFDVVLTADNTLDPADTITVNIAVADTGSVTGYFDAYTPAEVTISGATRTATVNITTNGDDQDRGDGEITLQVEPGAGYKLGTPSSVAFTINEDDVLTPPANAPVLTIEANPYSYADDGGNNYIIISDRDLTEALTVNYQVVSGGTPTDMTATFPVSESFINASTLSETANVREIRIVVTDANHTEVKLVAGSNYNLGTPSSATKVTAHEIASGGTGVYMKFLNSSVLEGDSATLVTRWTPRDRGNTYYFQFKVNDQLYASSDISSHANFPPPEVNTTRTGTITHVHGYHYQEIQTKERDTTIDNATFLCKNGVRKLDFNK